MPTMNSFAKYAVPISTGKPFDTCFLSKGCPDGTSVEARKISILIKPKIGFLNYPGWIK